MRRQLAWLLPLLVLLAAALPATAGGPGTGKPKLETRIKRTIQELKYRLPKKLRGHDDAVLQLFDATLDPTWDPGRTRGPRLNRTAVVAEVAERLGSARVAQLTSPGAPSPKAIIDRFDTDRVPPLVRTQIRHTIRQLRKMTRKVAADGDPELARLLAAEAVYAIENVLFSGKYDNEVIDGEGFGTSRRLVLLPPGARSKRAAILRSSQPGRVNLDQVVEAAAAHGIAPEDVTVIDLRFEGGWDENWVARGGNRPVSRVKVVRMPIVDRTIPTDDQVLEALRLVAGGPGKLVWLHCHGGVGRTGVMVAIMRVVFDGWSPERAIAEANKYDMWRPIQEHYVRDFAARWKSGKLRLD
ncbi:MAG TPA: hypothetical protein VFU21_31320 [Kofleriaceae bacterium]|nr:hypothetical protein [Kofleriaceae bacterium]